MTVRPMTVQPVTVPLLGLDCAAMDAPAAAAWLAARPADAPFGYVVTPNADHFVRLAGDPGLAAIYRGALLRLLDSRVVARAARLLGLAVPPVAPGSDLTECLLAAHVRPEDPVTVIGLTDPTVRRVAQRFGLCMPAHHVPPMGLAQRPEAMQAAVDFVLAHPARFVFLAVGSPQQEQLAAAIAATGRARGVGLCIGASLSFLAGTERRGPRWMQWIGAEWAFRLLRAPRRLSRRYLWDSPRVFALLWRVRITRR